MNLLLHTCCAPCAIFPIEELKKEGHKVAGLFYNPNIHPYSEYLRRKTEVEKYFDKIGIGLVCLDYEVESYFQYIVYNESLDKRCPICWWMRLKKVAELAREGGCESFTTTLLASPYQDQEAIRNICEDIAQKAGVKFYYKDFRAGFKKAHEIARTSGMYCQNYCGCIFSEKEKIEKRQGKK